MHGAAKHGLHRIVHQGILEGRDEFNVGHILLQPAPDAGVQVVEVFQHDCAFAILVKLKNGMTAKVLHRAAQLAADLARHSLAMKSLSSERPGYGAVRADQPKIEPEL